MSDRDKTKAATEQMLALIGNAITTWSFLEKELASIFTVCTCPVIAYPERGLDMTGSWIPLSVFYSVENLRGKLMLIDAALNARVSSIDLWAVDTRDDWARLREKVRKLSLKRNKLAHWTTLPAFQFQGVEHPARLVPPVGSPAYYLQSGLGKPNRLHPLHVQHLIRAFHLLTEKLRVFAHSLAAREELFDKYVEQVAYQIQTHDRLYPNRAERLIRALSSQE